MPPAKYAAAVVVVLCMLLLLLFEFVFIVSIFGCELLVGGC